MGLVDKDKDGIKGWDGKGTAPTDAENKALDQDDSNTAIGVPTQLIDPNTDPEYLAFQRERALLKLPSISVSTKAETTADINAIYQAAFGTDAPKQVADAYYSEVRNLQSSRTTGGTTIGAKVNVNTQGVSAQEINAIGQKYVSASATDLITAATNGDAKAQQALTRGNLGVNFTTLRNAYADNGLPINDKQLAKLATEALIDPNKLKGNLNLVQMNAKTFFPALADKIDAGYTVKQLLNPYLQTRASILEEDADNIDIKTLSGVAKDPKGLMNLYDYEVSLRKDPKWRFTKNAQDQLGGLANNIAKMFGLVG